MLFGNRHLLGIAAQIAEGADQLRARELEAALALAPSTVHRTLAALVRAGLLERLPREPGEREQRYARRSHPFWATASHLRQEARALDSARVNSATGGGSLR